MANNTAVPDFDYVEGIASKIHEICWRKEFQKKNGKDVKREKNGENINKPFAELNEENRVENILSAKSAINIYNTNSNIRDYEAYVQIHEDWKRRNYPPTEGKMECFVYFDKLDDYNKKLDINIWEITKEELKKR